MADSFWPPKGMKPARRGARRLNDEERVLWSDYTHSIAPLRPRVPPVAEVPQSDAAATPGTPSKPDSKAASKPPPKFQKPAKSKQHGGGGATAAPQKSVAPLTPLAPLGRRVKQGLGRGVLDLDGRLDLHGLTQAQAHATLIRFLATAQARGAKTVLVITGKGVSGARDNHFGYADHTDSERGILRRAVPLWLKSPELRCIVIGFETAHRAHGGDGALYIRVRRK
jgi:DNA-nicking Smr family endonuclease